MEERIQFITHRGKRILLIDYTDCEPAQILQIVELVRAEIATQAPHSVLVLADFTRAQIDKSAAELIKKVLALDRPYVLRSAWVGTDSLPKVFYDNFKTFSQRDFPKFATREEALDWLVKE